MKSLSNFNGQLVINISQADKDGNVTYLEYKISGFKSLTINNLVGTIAKEVFAVLNAQRFAGIRNIKSNLPVRVKISSTEGQLIADTARLDKAFGAKLRLSTEKSFAKVLFAGLSFVGHKAKVVNASEVIGDAAFIALNDKALWVKEIADKATESAEVVA